jgi:hypothetical protein
MGLIDKIKAADDVKKEIVHISEWDCDVEVRAFTAWVRSDIMDRSRDEKGEIDSLKLNELLLVSSTYDPETGKRLFTEDDLPWIREKAGRPIDDIVSALIVINKMSQEAVDEEAKN